VLQRLRRGRLVRARFVESHISKTLAFQTRALREKEGWSQQSLAEKIGSNQNAVYRAENPNYGKQTTTTLKKIAAAFDVALIVRFVPFSELTDWVSGTPRTIDGLTTEALTVPSFEAEEKDGVFDQTPTPTANEGYNALNAGPQEWAELNRRATEVHALLGSHGLPEAATPEGVYSGAIYRKMTSAQLGSQQKIGIPLPVHQYASQPDVPIQEQVPKIRIGAKPPMGAATNRNVVPIDIKRKGASPSWKKKIAS